MKYKKIISLLLVFVWMFIIFNFSNINSNKSNNDSKNISYKIIENGLIITNKLNITHANASVKALKISNDYNYQFRKIAHATEYFILSIFVFYLLELFRIKNNYIISILICSIYAFTDEFHQIFTFGRTPSYLDVLIDTLGCLLGLFIILFYKKIRGLSYEKN